MGKTSPLYYLNEGSNKLPTQDTLGRTITYECVATCNAYDNQIKYTIYDSNDDPQTYKVQFQSLGVTTPASITLHDVVDYIELPNGKKYEFEYDHAQGFLTKVILPSGGYIRYVYASPATNTSKSNVIERRVSADGSTEKTWTYSGNTSGSGAKDVVVTAPEGDYVEHSLSAQGTEYLTAYKTSGGVRLKRVEMNWDNVSVAENDQAENPVVLTIQTLMKEGAESLKTIAYNGDRYPNQERVYEWGQGAYGTLILQKDTTYTTITGAVKKPASETLTAYNPANDSWTTQGKTEYFYDEYTLTNRGSGVPNHTHSTTASGRGNLTRVLRYKDASNSLETQMYYDNVGNLIETIDPLGHSTTVDFTDNFTDTDKNDDNLFAFPKKVTNELGQYATSKYNWNTGLVMEVTNLRGYTTTTEYDEMNRVTSVTEANGKMTSYAYDDNNRTTTKTVTVSAGNTGQVTTTFDKLYRVTKTVTEDPEGAYAVDTEYDGNGRVKKTSNPYRSGGTVYWTQTTYDALSRPVTVTAPDSSAVQYAYFNNLTTTTDQAGNERRYTYNVLGQLTKVEEPNPTLYTSPIVTTYKYYGFGPLYRSTQGTQARTWVYNWLGQMTSQALPESGTTSFTYDGAGRLSTKTDARSIVTTMTYDNINRVTQRSYSDSTPTVSFTYDQSSQTGLRTAMSDGLGSVAYTYDTMDRLTQESRTLTGVSGTFSTSYAYNLKGDVTQMTYPSGRVVNFAYNENGGCCNSRLQSVADDTTDLTLVEDIQYNAAGGVVEQTLNPGSNAITETFSYSNERLQLTGIQAVKGGTTVMNFTYDYGTSSTNTGRVLKRTDAIQPEHSANYYYDPLYRLTNAIGVDGSWAISWGLDTWGNRTTQTPLGLATSKVGSQTMSYTDNKRTGVTNLTYDNAGNLTNEGTGGHYYAYNAENQQTSMDGGAATYAYDGEGRRMKKYTSTETTYTFYGPGGILCEFTTLNTGATAAASTDKTTYRTSEKTGTAVLMFNTSGTVIENNRTLPYGEAWLTDVASANDKKFTTYDRDKESGLDYAMNRMYASTMGRMTSPDKGPSRPWMPSSLNRYAYGGLDPINNTDLSGNDFMNSRFDCRTAGGYVTGIYVSTYFITDFDTSDGFSYGHFEEWQLGVECFIPPFIPWETAVAEAGVGGGGGGATPMPKDYCDRSDATNKKVFDFIANYSADANDLATISGIDASFILAWAARETGYGLGPAVTNNNNFFGLKPGTLAGDVTGGWIGAISCGGFNNPHPDNTCFALNPGIGLYASGFAAIFSQNGRYGNAALAAQAAHPGNVTAVFNAVGAAGFNPNGHYGDDVKVVWDGINLRKNCP